MRHTGFIWGLLLIALAVCGGCRTELYPIQQHTWLVPDTATTLVGDPPKTTHRVYGDTLEIVEQVNGDTTMFTWFDLKDTSRWALERPYTERYIHTGSFRPIILDQTALVMMPCDSLEFIFATDSVLAFYARLKAEAIGQSKRLFNRDLRQLERIKRKGSGRLFGDALAIVSSGIPFNVTSRTDVSMIIEAEFQTGTSAGRVYRVFNVQGIPVGYFARTRWII